MFVVNMRAVRTMPRVRSVLTVVHAAMVHAAMVHALLILHGRFVVVFVIHLRRHGRLRD
jgi:hypothetical protein